MRSSLHYRFSDLHRPPGTQYSVDPGYWPITVSCLTDALQFSTRPARTAIPAGSKLISIRHQPVTTLTDVRNARLTEKRIWIRVMDPTSSRWNLSLDSKRILQTYQHWLKHSPPIRPSYPLQNWSGEAAADACASGLMCQIVGYLKSPSGKFVWFSQRWAPKDFSSLGVTSEDMQRDISCYEALAQLALLFVASRMWFPDVSIFAFLHGVTTQGPNLVWISDSQHHIRPLCFSWNDWVFSAQFVSQNWMPHIFLVLQMSLRMLWAGGTRSHHQTVSHQLIVASFHFQCCGFPNRKSLFIRRMLHWGGHCLDNYFTAGTPHNC